MIYWLASAETGLVVVRRAFYKLVGEQGNFYSTNQYFLRDELVKNRCSASFHGKLLSTHTVESVGTDGRQVMEWCVSIMSVYCKVGLGLEWEGMGGQADSVHSDIQG